MSIVKTNMKLEPLKKRLWVLLDPMVYRWNGVTYEVTKGFVFDGASIPSYLRWLIPKNGMKLYAACLHDYFYRYKPVCRKEADRAFLAILLEKGEEEWKSYLMYYTLRAFGWIAWQR